MIRELRILPPLAIARFGGAATPMDNYDAVVDPGRPLGHRHLRPAETLEVDPATGQISRTFVPTRVRLHRERPGPPGGPLPRAVGADRRRPAGAADRRAAGAGPGLGRPMCAGGSSWPTSRSSAAPARMRTGSRQTAGTSPTTASTRWPASRSTSGRAGRSRSARSASSGRPRRTRSSGSASRRPRASSTAPAARRPRPGRRPTRTSATSSTTPPGRGGWLGYSDSRSPDHRARSDLRGLDAAGPEPRLPRRRVRRPGACVADRTRSGADRIRAASGPDRPRTRRTVCRSAPWPTSWSRRCSGPT